MRNFTKPKALVEGAVVGIAAASSPFSVEKFHRGVAVLKSLGFQVRYNEDIYSRKEGYLAGSDEVRAVELSTMLSDPDVDAIMFARGGYGIQRIMTGLDFSAFQRNPKVIVGYSDLTALTSYVTTQLKMCCLYGPVVTGLTDENEVTLSSLKTTLTSNAPLDPLTSRNFVVIKDGEAQGKLLGGCLSIISSSMGTDYEFDAQGAVLFLEDSNEKIYKYDRMLVHLKNSGLLKRVRGIIFGSMGLVEDETPEQLWKMVEDVLGDFDGPIIGGVSSGHTSPFLTLPLGVRCKLTASEAGSGRQEAGLIFEEAALV